MASVGALSRIAASAPLPLFVVSSGGLSCSAFLAPRVRTLKVHHFPTVGEPIKLKNSVGPFATPSNSQTVEKLAPENQRRKGEVARQKMRHQEPTMFDVEEGSGLAAVAWSPERVHI